MTTPNRYQTHFQQPLGQTNQTVLDVRVEQLGQGSQGSVYLVREAHERKVSFMPD